MKKTSSDKGAGQQQDSFVSEIGLLKKKSHPQLQVYILQLEKEVTRLQTVLAKQEVSYLSAFQKLKADFEAQKKVAENITVHFVSPDGTKRKLE